MGRARPCIRINQKEILCFTLLKTILTVQGKKVAEIAGTKERDFEEFEKIIREQGHE